jgi:flagellar biosynthesis/type III secretory pathway protein FliH
MQTLNINYQNPETIGNFLITSRSILALAEKESGKIIEQAETNKQAMEVAMIEQATLEIEQLKAKTILELANLKANLMEEARKEIIQIIMSISREVIANEVMIQKETIAFRIARALGEIQVADDAADAEWVVRINPVDFAVVENSMRKLCKHRLLKSRITLQEDENIAESEADISIGATHFGLKLDAHLNAIEEYLNDQLTLNQATKE